MTDMAFSQTITAWTIRRAGDVPNASLSNEFLIGRTSILGAIVTDNGVWAPQHGTVMFCTLSDSMAGWNALELHLKGVSAVAIHDEQEGLISNGE